MIGSRLAWFVTQSGGANELEGQDVIGRTGIEDESGRLSRNEDVDHRSVGHAVVHIKPDRHVQHGRHRHVR